MKGFLLGASMLVLAACAGTGSRGIHEVSIAGAEASAYGVQMRGVPVLFDGGEGQVIKADVRSRKSSSIQRNEGESAESGVTLGCYRAFAAAIERFQLTANQLGGTKIIRMRSDMNGQNASPGKFLCLVGASRVKVSLIGDIAR
ncbi:hypothetical protein [Suttonella ornithocola]|uniref:Excinuclease ATPase subunit n=1 Tax=Suttonella ornithocola TaxID=279832 RepID=A0A380MM58_9GAMM|nr:hypothetical protein [Suttonella ornithocola]SUO93338.1 Uncharacterised protein [Suttonella ornithocola]